MEQNKNILHIVIHKYFSTTATRVISLLQHRLNYAIIFYQNQVLGMEQPFTYIQIIFNSFAVFPNLLHLTLHAIFSFDQFL
jgi:hypothetical protein